jgi:hypothetical protein
MHFRGKVINGDSGKPGGGEVTEQAGPDGRKKYATERYTRAETH